jgi:hypothetical protein
MFFLAIKWVSSRKNKIKRKNPKERKVFAFLPLSSRQQKNKHTKPNKCSQTQQNFFLNFDTHINTWFEIEDRTVVGCITKKNKSERLRKKKTYFSFSFCILFISSIVVNSSIIVSTSFQAICCPVFPSTI